MTDRYARIREALAMGPTSGPWRCEHETGGGHDCWMMYSGDWPKAGGIVGYYTHTGPRHIPHVRPNTEAVAIAHHIAACDPDTIRALLEERDALEAENARLLEAAEDRCRAAAAAIGAVDGYDYRSGQEDGLSEAARIIRALRGDANG